MVEAYILLALVIETSFTETINIMKFKLNVKEGYMSCSSGIKGKMSRTHCSGPVYQPTGTLETLIN